MNLSLKMIWAGLGVIFLIALIYLIYRDIPISPIEIRKNIVIENQFKPSKKIP